MNFNKIPFLEISQLAMHDDTIGDIIMITTVIILKLARFSVLNDANQ